MCIVIPTTLLVNHISALISSTKDGHDQYTYGRQRYKDEWGSEKGGGHSNM